LDKAQNAQMAGASSILILNPFRIVPLSSFAVRTNDVSIPVLDFHVKHHFEPIFNHFINNGTAEIVGTTGMSWFTIFNI
jgi:hypothetical protein